MPDLSDISKRNMKKGSMGGSASKSISMQDEDMNLRSATAEEREALNIQRPSRPTPQNRPLPVFSDAKSEPRANKVYKDHGKSLEETSSAASSPGNSQRKHTPATIPRTKFTSATPLEQKIAINSLRQKLEYSDSERGRGQKDVRDEIFKSGGTAAASAVLYDQASVSSITESLPPSQLESDTSDMVDTSKITQRLNQVRDYLKQATSLYVNLSTKEYLEDSEMDHIEKLGKLIQQLRLQEQGYVDLLQRTLDMDHSANLTPSSSVMSLKQESDAENKEDQQQELRRLQMQHALLKKIVDQQQQIQDLKKKQATLASLQEQAEELMNVADMTKDDSSNAMQVDGASQRMNSLNHQPQMSRNRGYVSQETGEPANDEMDNEEAALFDADMVQRKLELENKLMNLQAKKEKMDALLATLKSSRDTLTIMPLDPTNDAMETQQDDHSTEPKDLEKLGAQRAALRQQQENAMQAMQQARDVQEKLRKLKEVKQRLEDLTSIVTEYEQSQVQPMLEERNSPGGQEVEQLSQAIRSQGGLPLSGHGGARPRDQFTNQPNVNADVDSKDLSNGIDNRMRPTLPSSRSQRVAIDVTRNPSSSKDNRANKDGLSSIEKNLASEDQDNDLTSKIRQLQEARQRLAFVQKAAQSLPSFESNKQASATAEGDSTSATMTESESEAESTTTAEDLSWQEDPEFQAKVRRLQQAKEKLKHLQELVNSVQQDGLAMDDLANISLSSKDSKENEGDDDDDDDEEDAAEGETDEEDEVTSEQQSEAGNDEDDAASSIVEEQPEDGASKQSEDSTLNNAVVMLDREIEYQAHLNRQRQELEKLLQEKHKLLEAQRQLTEIARTTLIANEEQASQDKQNSQSPRNAKKPPEVKFTSDNDKNLSNLEKSQVVEKPGNRVTYKDLQIPRIVKRTSNLSVEPQYGSDSDFRFKKRKTLLKPNKRQTGSRPNPMVMSELRRQREMFEQNKKLKFVEKQRRKQKSGDDHSDGGTYSIRSDLDERDLDEADLDEGVGHSMFSADVTTAATWGGSTEQSSSEEDSAVGEEDFPEGVEIEDEYDENMGQPEEEEEADGAVEEIEGDEVAPLFDFKQIRSKRLKKEKSGPWFNLGVQRRNQRGKKRKLDGNEGSRGSSVSWSMNVSPESSARHRPRQQNLTPAHKLMRSRVSRSQNQDNALWEEQCDLLRQQLASSSTLSNTLLRNQQTLLSILQNQTGSLDTFGGSSLFRPAPAGIYSPFGGYSGNYLPNQEQLQRHLLEGLERCTAQLDRQHRDIQSLQNDFQRMVLGPKSGAGRHVYPWENPSDPLLDSSFGQRKPTEPFKVPQQNSYPSDRPSQSSVRNSVPMPRPDLIHSATSPHTFTDDTRHRFTQTEIPSTVASQLAHSIFGQQNDQLANQANSKGKSTSPYGFYSFKTQEKQESGDFTQSTAISRPDAASLGQSMGTSYNPLVYTDSLTGVAVSNAGPDDVITTSYPTPSKSMAAKNLAQKQKTSWPSFLKDSENIDTASERSAPYGLNRREELEAARVKKETEQEDKMERLSVASSYSLFETMRDSIYSEVATLISMNESRPHYLVELFRELQLLTSDYLRQRALYALQDLVTRFLTEDSEARPSSEPPEEVYRKWMDTAAVEQTPSESVVTSDDEDQETKALEALSSQIRNNDMYDYAEIAETGSTMSTPTSNQDPPFAAEGLGDTVINLDEALQKMRSYEERMAEARKKANELDDDDNLQGAAAADFPPSENSSAYDVASETSSDIQQPSIDTQKLDRQIKSIMKELIPFLNEHMEIQCTPSFLSELKSLILRLAKEKEPEAEKQEFGRSFHRQLESVLKDSLSRFESRSLKECGEDILIDVSEILFNELAFFRLMQDLDRPLSKESYWRKDSDSRQLFAKASGNEGIDAALTGLTSGSYEMPNSSVGLLVNTSGTIFSPPAPRTNGPSAHQRQVIEDGLEVQDIEDNEENGSDAEDETEAARQFVNVELSVSESRPVASTGSGEDDEEEDQPSFPMQNAAPESSVGAQQQQQQILERQQEQIEGAVGGADDDDVDDVDAMPEDEEIRSSPKNDDDEDQESVSAEDERGEDEREEGDRDLAEMATMGGISEADARPDSADAYPSNEDGDESEITVDDLPTKLTGLTEADLQTRMESEQNIVEGAAGILSHLDTEQELVDDSGPQPQQQAENSDGSGKRENGD